MIKTIEIVPIVKYNDCKNTHYKTILKKLLFDYYHEASFFLFVLYN